VNKYREGKVKRTAVSRVKQNLKLCACNQSERYAAARRNAWRRAFWRMNQRVTSQSRRVKAVTAGAGAKASLKRASKWLGVDTKPGELTMVRVKRK